MHTPGDVLLGFIALFPLIIISNAMEWMLFTGWGMSHGGFIIAWPVLSLVAYLICGDLPWFKR